MSAVRKAAPRKRIGTVAPRKPKQGSVVPASAVRVVQSEAAFQRAVERLLDLYGWRWHHEVDSRKSKPGFPDLIACRRDRALAIELKSARGVLSADQREWIAALQGSGVETHIWRPKDMDEVVKVLS